jgi:putative nucleotidyltransferase with HDIG domain
MESAYNDLVVLLCSGISHGKLYPSTHPKMLESAQKFVDALRELLREQRKESFFLGIVDGRLVHDGRFLVGPTIVGRRLLELGERTRCGGFLFNIKAEVREVSLLFSLSGTLKERVPHVGEAQKILTLNGVKSVGLSPEYEDPGWFGQFFFDRAELWDTELVDGEDLDSLVPVFQGAYEAVESTHDRVARGAELDIDGVRSASDKFLQATRGGFSDIMRLVRYPDYDSYTVGHSVRVASILVIVCRRLGLEDEQLLEVATAGFLHDVGKARIPEKILFKPGRLDPEERRVIERHTLLGAEILLENRAAGPLSVASAWGHHLRHDGSGYPQAKPAFIPSASTSLVHVCDVFEALTAIRPYKKEMAPRRAYEIMLADRASFDPAAFSALRSAIGLYPPGSRVRLTTGQRAVVLAAGAEMDRPTVRLTHDTGGEQLAPMGAPVLDLSSPDERSVSISGLVAERVSKTRSREESEESEEGDRLAS